MRNFKNKSASVFSAGTMALLVALAAPVSADDDKGLPAEQLISAIETAVAATPGMVKEVEVDNKGWGKDKKVVVEVKVVDANGKETEVVIDPQTKEIMK